MVPNLTSIIAILILGTTTAITIMFLPAILELRKPKDGGPRLIMDSLSGVQMQILGIIPIASLEEEQKFDVSFIRGLAKIIEVLPSLEV
jgi:hypothetical protein